MSSMLVSLRKMYGEVIYVVNLRGLFYGSVKYDYRTNTIIRNALLNGFRSFIPYYDDHETRDCFTLEDVFHSAILGNFEVVAYTKGIDIIYDNVTVHMRIIVEDRKIRNEHATSIEKCEYITAYQGSTVVVKFDKYQTDDENEWWEYDVIM